MSRASQRSLSSIVVLGTVLMLAASASADNLTLPPWVVGEPGTTHGEWEFLNNSPNPLPEPGFLYPYGPPITTVIPSAGQSWLPAWGGRQGVWPADAIEVNIPNRPEPFPRKYFRVQLTWAPQVLGNSPTVSEKTSGGHITFFNTFPLEPINQPPYFGNWQYSSYLMYMEPNPPFEIIRIDGGLFVDELVIDTICEIPEPATLCLLAAGGLCLAGRLSRARRRSR